MIDITNLEPEKIQNKKENNTKNKTDFFNRVIQNIDEYVWKSISADKYDKVRKLYINLCNYIHDKFPDLEFTRNICIDIFVYCVNDISYHDPYYEYAPLVAEAGKEVMEAIRAYIMQNDILHDTHYRFTPLWWDPTGTLRKEHFLSPAQVRLLNITPARNSRLFQHPAIARHIIEIYLHLIDRLLEEQAFPKRSVIKKRIKAILDNQYYFRKRNSSFNNFLRYLLKVSENIVRKDLPSSRLTKVLSEEKEIEAIKNRLLKKGAATFDQILSEQKSSLSEEDVNTFVSELEKRGEPVWPFVLDQLRKADPARRAEIIGNLPPNQDRLYKELLKEPYDLRIIALYKLLQQKKTPALQKLLTHAIHSSWYGPFEDLLNKTWDQKVYETLLQMKEPKRRHIILSKDELGQARKQFLDTVDTVNAFLPAELDNTIAEEKTNNEQTIVPQEKWSLKNLVLRLLDHPMPIEQFEDEAAAQHTFSQSLIDQINEQYYDLVNDAILIADGDLVQIDPYYIDYVKEALHEN